MSRKIRIVPSIETYEVSLVDVPAIGENFVVINRAELENGENKSLMEDLEKVVAAEELEVEVAETEQVDTVSDEAVEDETVTLSEEVSETTTEVEVEQEAEATDEVETSEETVTNATEDETIQLSKVDFWSLMMKLDEIMGTLQMVRDLAWLVDSLKAQQESTAESLANSTEQVESETEAETETVEEVADEVIELKADEDETLSLRKSLTAESVTIETEQKTENESTIKLNSMADLINDNGIRTRLKQTLTKIYVGS